MSSESQNETELLHRTVESLRAELLTVYEELASLHSLGAKMGRSVDENQIGSVALQEALDVTRADCGWVVLWEGERSRVPAGCRVGIEPGTVEQVVRTVLERLYYRKKRQVLSHAFPAEYHLEKQDAPIRFLASCLSVGESLLGYLCLGRGKDGRKFTAADQKLVSAVASLVAVELDNVRLRRAELEKARLETELELARRVQESLAPRDFRCSDFLEAAGASVPCYEVGGDYFDLHPLGSDRCLLVMADVAGKGPAAALQAAMLQGMVHAASRHTCEVPALMRTINECTLQRAGPGTYATVFLAILERTGCLRYSNGGHNPPLWIGQQGRVNQLTEGGPLLGLLKDAVYQEGVIRMAPGDLLLLYTDGVTEAENPQGETWGLLQLLDWASRHAGEPPGELERALLTTVTQFSAGRRPADDLTVLLARYCG